MFYDFMFAEYRGLFDYPEIDTPEAKQIDWLFSGISVEQCRLGMQKIKDNPPQFPPVPAHFVRLCTGMDSSNDHKAIHNECARHWHKNAELLISVEWSSPLAYHVAVASKQEIRDLPPGRDTIKETMPIIERHYRDLLPRAGELVIPKALVERKEPKIDLVEYWSKRGVAFDTSPRSTKNKTWGEIKQR